MLSIQEGSSLVSLARRSAEYFIASGELLSEGPLGKAFLEKRGVFVSLHTYPSNDLRGCIGFPYPTMPLWNAVMQASVSAAFEDTRFPLLQASELGSIVFEVTVLSKPVEFKCKKGDLPEEVKIGEHGLIVEKGMNSGLLLPQVAVEFGWSPGDFLCECSRKAGLSKNAWKDKETRVSCFNGMVFSEEKPKGRVAEKKI